MQRHPAPSGSGIQVCAARRRYADSFDVSFAGRDVPYLVNPEANWEDEADDEANVAWARACLADLEAHALEGLYLNFPGFLEEGAPMMRSAFGAQSGQSTDFSRNIVPPLMT